MMEIELCSAEKKALQVLLNNNSKMKYTSLLASQNFNNPEEIRNAISWLKMKGLVEITENIDTRYSLTSEGKRYAEKGLPERLALGKVLFPDGTQLSEEETKIAIIWLRKKEYAVMTKDKATGRIQISPTEAGEKYYHTPENLTPDELVLTDLLKTSEQSENMLNPDGLKLLKQRKNVIKSRDVVDRTIILTSAGSEMARRGFVIEDEISQLTPEHLQNGSWKSRKIRKYHVESFAPTVHGGLRHPLRELMAEVRDIFVEMGFSEIEYDYVQPCFWNMDALFIPQDHPARDIQDTFYLRNPVRIPIADKVLTEKVREIHETGGNTGSDGWKYRWSEIEAERTILRTHTTVNTIRYLSAHPNPPVKVFSIGRIFRNEATDATHLSELHQIEGIVMEESASLAMLIGTLKEFYRRVGFPDVHVAPSYYPYTEPSMDVYIKQGGMILELGGSGIFRPEVIAPFDIEHQVLAWGLGLERLAMIKWGIDDIRDTMTNDLLFLKERKLTK